VAASSSLGMGCAVPARETSSWRALAAAGRDASAAAPAAAPFRNLRRSIASFWDFRIVIPVENLGRFSHSLKFYCRYGHLMAASSACQTRRTFVTLSLH